MSGEHGSQIGPVMVFSARPGEVAEFYKSVLGLSGDTGDDSIWLEGENAKLVVHGPGEPDTPAQVSGAAGFVVWFGVADVRAAYERAKKAGRVVGDFHGDFFYATDPDGRHVGVYTLEDHHGHDHEH